MKREMLKKGEVTTSQEAEAQSWIKDVLCPLVKPQRRLAVLVSGPLGAGKTFLTRYLLTALGVGEEAVSPSFALHNHYEDETGRGVDHIDLYRLEDEDDLESTGFWDVMSQDEGLVVIEWADRLEWEFLPSNWPLLVIEVSFPVKSGQATPSGTERTWRFQLLDKEG